MDHVTALTLEEWENICDGLMKYRWSTEHAPVKAERHVRARIERILSARASTLESRIEKRIRDWFASTSESYAGAPGSDAWIAGMLGYIMVGPGSITGIDSHDDVDEDEPEEG